MFNPAKVFLQFFTLPLKFQRFLFGVLLDSSISNHRFNFFQPINAGFNRCKVGQHSTQPAVIDKILVRSQRLFLDRILGLFFGTDKQDLITAGNSVLNKLIGGFEIAYSFLQVNNVDAVTGPKDVGLHFRVPALGLMTKMNAGFKHLFHGDLCHFCFSLSSLGIQEIGLVPPFRSTPTGLNL